MVPFIRLCDDRIISRNLWPPKSPDLTTPDNICYRAYEAHVRDREEKAADVDQEFLQTPAMNTEEWKKPNFELRHVFTRTAAHGFHHRICAKRGYHSASEQCICTLCGHSCSQYHILTCQARTETLTFYAKEGNF
ncbi:hypothetical protein ANN_02543 [Periplaneta americana]|uniref:Uncharacterized protein n=1 Tax=Periplaneta americana TaxID=6978 RepID=A0ABQ8TWP4_PERAM|nr:hypothetical protein ANN_02543 [Periplaneta americana]